MEEKFLSIINGAECPALIKLDEITDLQIINQGGSYFISYNAVFVKESERFDDEHECIKKFKRVVSLIKAKQISIENAQPGILAVAVKINKSSKIMLRNNDDPSEDKYKGKGFIHYCFKKSMSPFEEDNVVSEMFDSYDEAKETFDELKKSLCHCGLEVINVPKIIDGGE